jgi:hypothetical protein
MNKKDQLVQMLDQIILKYEWEDSKIKNELNGDSWDVFHLKKFKELLLYYINEKEK